MKDEDDEATRLRASFREAMSGKVADRPQVPVLQEIIPLPGIGVLAISVLE